MSKRIAALDLGTNTFHLIIADIEAGSIRHRIYEEQKPVKLGEGGINEGRISEEAFKRGVEALKHFKSCITNHNVQFITAVGTAALRTAQNGVEFIEAVKTATGIQIEIIDGDLEAYLIYQGVKQAVELIDNTLIMDIGGGSVEFIIANFKGVEWKKSYPIGAAKLMASFHHTDPISTTEVSNINNYLDDVLSDLKHISNKLDIKTLIGSAGAFETFAVLCEFNRFGTVTEMNQRYEFDLQELKNVISDILLSTHQQRKLNTAILPVRTDMIVVASVLTQYIIKRLNIEEVQLSTFALKEGLLISPLR